MTQIHKPATIRNNHSSTASRLHASIRKDDSSTSGIIDPFVWNSPEVGAVRKSQLLWSNGVRCGIKVCEGK